MRTDPVAVPGAQDSRSALVYTSIQLYQHNTTHDAISDDPYVLPKL